MPQKPPAFQFYVKDWRSSPTVSTMSYHERGVYIELLAASWDSEEQGTLPLPLQKCSKFAHIPLRILRKFVADYPQCFTKSEAKLINRKLFEQGVSYRELSEKRKLAAESRYANAHANASHLHHSSSSSASASASKTNIPPTPHAPKPRVLVYSEEFLTLWKIYPRKDSKFKAFEAFQKSSINGNLPALLKSIEDHKACQDWQRDGGKWIPYLATFINQRRWEDENDEAV